MIIYKRNILIFILLCFSCDNPLESDSSISEQVDVDPCSIYIQEDQCTDIENQKCQWILDECASSDFYSCTVNYGGYIHQECNICVGGTTNVIPKDICGVCQGDATIENVDLHYDDYDIDDDLYEDLLCGCSEPEEGDCCGTGITRGACGICGGDGEDEDGDGICDEEEVLGCQDESACNYDDTATEAGDCTYVDGICESCEDGIIVDNDADDDTVCDADENVGCIDDGNCTIETCGFVSPNPGTAACNYDDTATDAGDCTYVDGICETCEDGLIVDNDSNNDGTCGDIEGCRDASACNYNENATEEGNCEYASDLDECATCSGETDGTGIIIDNDADDDQLCDADEVAGCTDESACNYNELATDEDNSCLYEEDCAGICGGTSVVDCLDECDGGVEIDCAGECGGDSVNDECGVCDNDFSNDCIQDCAGVWGGTAYYNYCGNCVGGTTGLLHTYGEDDCGICYGNNEAKDFCNVCFGDNSECTQGILTQSVWNFDYIGNWQNPSCEGPSHYDFYNYICLESTCFDYSLEFDIDNRFIFKGVSWDASLDCDWLLNSDNCTTTNLTDIEGTWSLDVQTYSPLIINSDNLCLNYDDPELDDFCFESIDLLNNYDDCLSGEASCDNNVLFLTISNEGVCSKEQYSSEGFISSNQNSYNISSYDNLSIIAKNIISQLQNNTQ